MACKNFLWFFIYLFPLVLSYFWIIRDPNLRNFLACKSLLYEKSWLSYRNFCAYFIKIPLAFLYFSYTPLPLPKKFFFYHFKLIFSLFSYLWIIFNSQIIFGPVLITSFGFFFIYFPWFSHILHHLWSKFGVVFGLNVCFKKIFVSLVETFLHILFKFLWIS